MEGLSTTLGQELPPPVGLKSLNRQYQLRSGKQRHVGTSDVTTLQCPSPSQTVALP